MHHRTRIYIDGYNLYYGCLKGSHLKWLDLIALFEKQIVPSIMATHQGSPIKSELAPLAIKLFTAKIHESAAKSADSVSSQSRYHTALRKLYDGRLSIIEGYYSRNPTKVRTIDANDPGRPYVQCPEVTAWKLEEKQSDVNLALHAYHDALSGEVDQVIFVTNDTDIAPAMQMVRHHSDAIVGLVIPTTDHVRNPNGELAELAHWVRSHITVAELEASQLPRVIPGRKPTIKPDSWYRTPDIFMEVLELTIAIRGSRSKAFQWLHQENIHFDGRSPLQTIEATDDGAQAVLDYINLYLEAR